MVTVLNVSPSFVPVGGMPIQGDEINTLGITRIRVSFSDPGYDNPLNLNPAIPPAVGDPLAESFTYIVDWGDGTIDTIMVSDMIGGAVVVNAQTTVIASNRTSGSASVLTTGSFEVQHRYLGPPDPLNPTADIVITLTLLDDNGGSVEASVAVGNPGIETTMVAIDTTPQVPRLEFAPPAPPEALLDQQSSSVQGFQSTTVRVAGGELTATSERYLVLVVISPDGEESEPYLLKDEALLDLRGFFATLPENRYRIYLVRTDNIDSWRLVIEVSVRRYYDRALRQWRGRIVDPNDVSEGTRDRPPTSEAPVDAVPLEENPLLEPLSKAADPAAGEPQPGHAERQPGANEAAAVPPPPGPEPRFLRWSLPLAAGLALAAGSGDWSQRLEAALRQADQRAWQRLRRIARARRPAGSASTGGIDSPIVPREYNEAHCSSGVARELR
jgi:hypothetical protein